MHQLTRRQALRTLFCASAALSLNLRPRQLQADDFDAFSGDQHLLLLGDFGSNTDQQHQVAAAMRAYVAKHQLCPSGLFLLGDNFYGKMDGGVFSPRWQTGFEDMYPASSFPGPAWVVLGNHDYHDNIHGDQVQLQYPQRHPSTRWTLPSKWYRVDFPHCRPLVTFLCLDSNVPAVSGPFNSKLGRLMNSLTPAEDAAQLAWLKCELTQSRAPFTVVIGHHPLYSNGSHGDTKPLINQWGRLFEEHGVHAYVCGHDHDLQHLELTNLKTSFVISGGGGAKLRKLKPTHQAAFAEPVHGFTHLQINGERLLFRHIDPTGTQLHAFAKHVDHRMSLV